MPACATVYRAPLVLLLKRFCYSALSSYEHGRNEIVLCRSRFDQTHSFKMRHVHGEDRPLLPSPQNIATSIIALVVAREAARAAPDTSVDGLVVGADGLVVGADGGAGGQPML